VLYYNTLGKGDAALSRFIPLADGFVHGTQSVPTFHTIKTYGRFITIQGSVPATPKNPMMISSRPTVRRFDALNKNLLPDFFRSVTLGQLFRSLTNEKYTYT